MQNVIFPAQDHWEGDRRNATLCRIVSIQFFKNPQVCGILHFWTQDSNTRRDPLVLGIVHKVTLNQGKSWKLIPFFNSSPLFTQTQSNHQGCFSTCVNGSEQKRVFPRVLNYCHWCCKHSGCPLLHKSWHSFS